MSAPANGSDRSGGVEQPEQLRTAVAIRDRWEQRDRDAEQHCVDVDRVAARELLARQARAGGHLEVRAGDQLFHRPGCEVRTQPDFGDLVEEVLDRPTIVGRLRLDTDQLRPKVSEPSGQEVGDHGPAGVTGAQLDECIGVLRGQDRLADVQPLEDAGVVREDRLRAVEIEQEPILHMLVLGDPGIE